jgi:hypothetical protein
MFRYEESLLSYLELVTGYRPQVEPASRISAVPLFLRERFEFLELELFGRSIVLAVEKAPPDELSATEYGRMAMALKRGLERDVALVMAKLPSFLRNRLVREGVPFIVPGAQMFLPMLMVDLRERFSGAASRVQDKLSPVSQLVVIHQILREQDAHIPLSALGARLKYSAQAMSFAQDQLQCAKLCEVRRIGKMIFLEFSLRGTSLWQKAEPLMASPVRKTQWVRWGQPRARAVAAGTTALSRLSMLAEDQYPTYAMRDRDLVSAFEKGQLFGCSTRDEANARMESWKYDPWVLAENDAVDPCSLYLSLRNSGDERIQKEIKSLIERLPQ